MPGNRRKRCQRVVRRAQEDANRVLGAEAAVLVIDSSISLLGHAEARLAHPGVGL